MTSSEEPDVVSSDLESALKGYENYRIAMNSFPTEEIQEEVLLPLHKWFEDFNFNEFVPIVGSEFTDSMPPHSGRWWAYLH